MSGPMAWPCEPLKEHRVLAGDAVRLRAPVDHAASEHGRQRRGRDPLSIAADTLHGSRHTFH